MNSSQRFSARGAHVRTAVLAFVLTVAVILSVAAPANAATTRTVSGTVTCKNGHEVVGVWVSSSGGGSGWASYWRTPSGKAAYYKRSVTTAASSTTVRLSVGCGGATSAWWSDNLTPTATVAGSRTLNTICSESSSPHQAQRCIWPPKGLTTTTNLGAAGNCTWGALQEWKTRTGSYPLTAGNAKDWNTTAATNKWYVTSVPTKRSIVVFEAGVQGSHPTYGHVAYVLDVLPQGGGAFKIYVREMNASASHGGGFGTYNYWTYTHTAGMSYIVSTL